MPKRRINVHVTEEVGRMLDHALTRPGTSKGVIVDAALASFLTGEADDRRDAALIKRLDRMDRAMGRLEQHFCVTAETLSLFVLYYLTATGPIPEQNRQYAESLGRKRFDRFIGQVAQRLSSGKSLTINVIQELTPTEEDFFTSADFEEENES